MVEVAMVPTGCVQVVYAFDSFLHSTAESRISNTYRPEDLLQGRLEACFALLFRSVADCAVLGGHFLLTPSFCWSSF